MSKKLKRIGEDLNIRNIVIHQLLKSAGNRTVNSKSANAVLQVGEKEKIFLGNLDKSYHQKSSPIYGVFAGENPRFKNLLVSYKNEETPFFDFSVEVMKHYKKILKSTISATGGYMILCEYTNLTTKKDLLLVLMINNKEGFVVNERDLTLNNVKNLDLSKVDIACLINLTEWANIENNDPTDRKTYLSFVKGLKQVSYYFMQFIDVDNKNTSTESTNRLIKAIDDYAVSESWARDFKIKQRNKVYAYCHECIDNKREISLSTISTILDPDNPEKFQDFATNEKYKVSAIISGDKTKMKLLKVISYADDELKIEFDTNLLMNNRIHYDEKSNKLTIKDVPGSLQKKILELNNNA